MKVELTDPSPATKFLGGFLEFAFVVLLFFVFYIFIDWLLFPEKKRPWR